MRWVFIVAMLCGLIVIGFSVDSLIHLAVSGGREHAAAEARAQVDVERPPR